MSVLSQIADEVEQLDNYVAERLAEMRAKLLAYDASLGKQGKVTYVGPDGRLTEAGVRYCEKAFAEGRGPTEIATTLGVTVPAIVMRRQRWLKQRNRGSR